MNEFGDTAVSRKTVSNARRLIMSLSSRILKARRLCYHAFCPLNLPRIAKTINVSTPDDPTAESTEEILELANGCLCCSIKDTGAAAIEKLMQRKGAFDYILLETTGLADPGVSYCYQAMYG